jgi:hypothetical protein
LPGVEEVGRTIPRSAWENTVNLQRGFGRILDSLVGSLWAILTGAVEIAIYVWDGFFGPPDEPPKEPERHRH